MQVKSSLAQLSKQIRGAEAPAEPSELAAGTPPPSPAPGGAPGRPPPSRAPRPTRGLPLCGPCFSRRFPPAPRCPRSSGRPRDAHSRRPAGPWAARVLPGRKAPAAAPRGGPGVQRRLGSSAPDPSPRADTGPGPPGWAFLFFPSSFPHFQDFSRITITSNCFLFTAGINLHLLGEALSEFPPASPLGGLGCPVIYALFPRGSALAFPRAWSRFGWEGEGLGDRGRCLNTGTPAGTLGAESRAGSGPARG